MADHNTLEPTHPVIEAVAATKTTFAAAQNSIPIIKQLRIRNDSNHTYNNLRLTLTAQPAFCRSKEWTIDRIAECESIEVGETKVTLDYNVLDKLNEAEHGQLVFKLFDGDQLLNEHVHHIEVLARDEWGGTGEMAQILAAFVSPNHSVVSAILKEASKLLEQRGLNGSHDGYMSNDPKRAYMLAAAIWSASSGLGLSYAQPPRSFEKQGQKIRGPGAIKETGLATCLDTTLLLAAAFEAAGLNPVVIFTQGHAFVGVWIVNKTFGQTKLTDLIDVQKAVDARELITLETTLLTQRPAVGFREANSNANAQLSDDADKPFHLAIDIARARAADIRPISDRMANARTGAAASDPSAPAALPPVPALDFLPVEYEEFATETPDNRLTRWQKKLLDLTLRNRLLNFKYSKQTLKLICHDVAKLEDKLADGKKFKIISINDENPTGGRDTRHHLQQTGNDIETHFAREVFERSQVCADQTANEMQSRLTTLYRKSRSDMAEGGTNTLFLAIGFLKWKKSPDDEKSYQAPLLLVPVKLTRRSVHSSYYLSHLNEGVVFNQTLLQHLQRDFGIEMPALHNELPKDESGIDIPKVLEIARRGVRDTPGFRVVEDIALSTFSFAKYLMWKDLRDRTDSLKDNRLVKHLLDNPAEPFSDGTGEFVQPEMIDQTVDHAKLYTPLPADSSQTAAIIAAQSGKDFVIIGPPGTGKSQTIANIIAHCLAHGKTILFVAEKSAALDVVYRRLEEHGLADACLELHSNKTDRKKVIAQLGAAWDRSVAANTNEWSTLAQSLKIKQNELNLYVSELHEPGSHGNSVFDAFGIVAEKTAKFTLSFPNVNSHDQTSFRSLIEIVERLSLIHPTIKDCEVLDGITNPEWTYAWQTSLLEAGQQLQNEAEQLRSAYEQLVTLLGLPLEQEIPSNHLKALVNLAVAIEQVIHLDFSFVANGNLLEINDSLHALSSISDTCTNAQLKLSAQYPTEQIQKIPLNDFDIEWRNACAKLWPFSLLGKRRIKKLLQSYASSGTADPACDLLPLIEIQEALSVTKESPARLLPGFCGVESDVLELFNIVERARKLETACNEVEQATGSTVAVLDLIKPVLPRASETTPLANSAQQLRDSAVSFKRCHNHYNSLAGAPINATSLQSLIDTIRGIEDQSQMLNDWSKWSQAKLEAETRGLGPVVEALSSHGPENLVDDFLVAYFTWWIPLAIDSKPMLRSFAHWEQEDRIVKFRALIQDLQDLAATEVRRAISPDLPTRDSVPRRSELGILRHQLGLQRPSASIRSLIKDMPDTFTKLTPCVLMSPLSVAQYLPAKHAEFDMVIFDEASQITTWDAIGAIARGKQSIIVGDPKQLPPTNFFGRADDDSDDDSDLEHYEKDLPSILDEASAAGLPLHQLNWHYRSRDEALIAFSNHHYYGQRLITFPSPETESGSVKLHHVDGIYARGSGRTNKVEAQAVVEFIICRLEEWIKWPEEDRLSIGVITFNAQQQELILDLLDAERADRTHLDWFFGENRVEPVIVKNLENIQGDERDIMIFSITFGRDLAGKLTMDFGAVNREGGEKRLNVAVTRAKSEFHVFSSITAEDIRVREKTPLGVMHLKNYLDYAARGSIALAAIEQGSGGPAENPFEESVKAALQSRGWEIRTQVGVSGFRIDLGVIHPDKAGAYLAGIECDGATYHRSATARDRDQIREGVLRNLGWSILRIWSTDWFMHPDMTLDRIDTGLKELLELSRNVDHVQSESTPNEPDLSQSTDQN